MIPINKPLIDEREVEAVTSVLRSGLLTSRTHSASMVGRFEKGFAEFVEAKHAFAVNSGTSALQMSLLVSNVGNGDEVIVPSFTFVSTAETVVLVGAKPIFIDINPENYNIDIEKIEDSITKRTKAIIPVDIFGLPVDMKQLREKTAQHNLAIIEDACQAHGARYHGKHVGNLADLACWSFYASKNMTTGEGGMITTNNDKYAEELPYMRTHGEKGEYVSSMLGGNFRMPEMEAAVGCVQLEKLPEFLKRRRENAERLIKNLHGINSLRLPIVPKGYTHSWYLFTVQLTSANRKRRDKVVNELRKLGIGATTYYPIPIHMMPYYRKYSAGPLLNTETAADKIFSLPVHPGVSTDQIDYIADTLRTVLQKNI